MNEWRECRMDGGRASWIYGGEDKRRKGRMVDRGRIG